MSNDTNTLRLPSGELNNIPDNAGVLPDKLPKLYLPLLLQTPSCKNKELASGFLKPLELPKSNRIDKLNLDNLRTAPLAYVFVGKAYKFSFTRRTFDIKCDTVMEVTAVYTQRYLENQLLKRFIPSMGNIETIYTNVHYFEQLKPYSCWFACANILQWQSSETATPLVPNDIFFANEGLPVEKSKDVFASYGILPLNLPENAIINKPEGANIYNWTFDTLKPILMDKKAILCAGLFLKENNQAEAHTIVLVGIEKTTYGESIIYHDSLKTDGHYNRMDVTTFNKTLSEYQSLFPKEQLMWYKPEDKKPRNNQAIIQGRGNLFNQK